MIVERITHYIRTCMKYWMNASLPVSPVTSIGLNDIEFYDGVQLEDAEPFVPPIKFGKVVKIIDGTAILIVAKLPYPTSKLYQFMIRVKHVENSEDDNSDSSNESNKKSVLSKFILGKVVEISELEYCGEDLYAYLYYDYVCINTFMILNRKVFLQ